MAYVCVAWSTGAGSGVPLCSLVRADAAQWIFGSSTCSAHARRRGAYLEATKKETKSSLCEQTKPFDELER